MTLETRTGEKLLYGSATGLEKAMASVSADRLLDIKAELIIENWDPWLVQERNLSLLAWEMGTNLWPDFWSVDEKRSWVARQWYLQSIRGTNEGLREFIHAMRGELKRVLAPPLTPFPGPTYTLEERAAFVARFAQLRLYPYVARVQLPYLCFPSKLPDVSDGIGTVYSRNGSFAGGSETPLFFPTNADAGGRYTRTATLWDHGVETPLTFRKIVRIGQEEEARSYDEVILDERKSTKYYCHEPYKYPRPAHTPDGTAQHGIFLGRIERAAARSVIIPRDGTLSFDMPKAQYQTILPDYEPINIYPDHKYQEHTHLDIGRLFARRKQYLARKYLPPSDAWQYVYEVLYMFDADRIPEERRRNLFMGNQWFGIPPFTAKARIKVFGKLAPRYMLRFVSGFMKPKNIEAIERMRQAVNASRRFYDTILIDTKIMRNIEVRDPTLANGQRTVGQLIEA